MHKIDLLKGQGIPTKTTSGGLMLLSVAVIVPLLVAAGMLDWYMRTKTNIEIAESSIENAEKVISKYTPDLKQKESLDRQIILINTKLTEVSRCLDTFLQWSPILRTLAEEIPGPMIMSDLTAQSASTTRRTGRRANDPNKPVTIPIPERKLVMNIRGLKPGNYDPIVQKFQESLNESPVLKPKLENIVHSRQAGEPGTEQTESHEMNIIFASEKK